MATLLPDTQTAAKPLLFLATNTFLW